MTTNTSSSSNASSKSFFGLFLENPVTHFDLDKIFASQQARLQAFTRGTQIVADSMQAILRHQVDAVNEATEERIEGLRHLVAPGNIQDKFSQEADFARKSLERTLSSFRDISDILVKSQAELSRMAIASLSDSLPSARKPTEKKSQSRLSPTE